MSEPRLKTLSDLTEQAHARIQAKHEDINPVVSLRQGLRDNGIPADAMTIDCMRTRKRILLVLHDEQPEALLYQFTTLEREMEENWQELGFEGLTAELLFDWMRDYFSPAK